MAIHCSTCGQLIPEDAPQGFCPGCVLAASNRRIPYFGDYELGVTLGAGGSGTVYRAKQVSLSRSVALKVLRSGRLATGSERQRFQVEAQAAARLDHPNIVPIFEVGEHQGWPYLSMKLVEGSSLATRIQELREVGKRFPALEAVNLIRIVAEAVDHAHRRGVLHRDLKPHNILIDGEMNPFVTDFGLAKLSVEEGGLTKTNSIFGTPHYMSPEQIRGATDSITLSTDVYSLGVILYELLTGRVPFDDRDLGTLAIRVTKEEPLSPRRWNPGLDRDLETICLKCLSKEPRNRYESAGALARDLSLWVDRKPILARPVGILDRTLRLVRRHPTLSALSFAILAIVTLFSGLLVNQRNRTKNEQQAKLIQALRADAIRDGVLMRRVEEFDTQGHPLRAMKELGLLLEISPSNRVAATRLHSMFAERSFLWPQSEIVTQETALYFAQYTADGSALITCSTSGPVYIRDPIRGELKFKLPHGDTVTSIEVAQQTNQLLTACKDSIVRVWNFTNGQLLDSYRLHASSVNMAVWSSNRQWIASASDDRTAAVQGISQQNQGTLYRLSHTGAVAAVAFSPDSSMLVTASEDRNARVWRTGAPTNTVRSILHPAGVSFVVFSPDGGRFLTVCDDFKVRVFDSASLELLHDRIAHRNLLTTVEFSPDGKRILTAAQDTISSLWDATSGALITNLLSVGKVVMCARHSQDGSLITTASFDGKVRVFDSNTYLPVTEASEIGSYGLISGLHPRSNIVVAGNLVGQLRTWSFDRSTNDHSLFRMTNIAAMAMDPAGTLLVSGNDQGACEVWDTSQRRRLLVRDVHQAKIRAISFKDDGSAWCSIAADGSMCVTSIKRGELISQDSIPTNGGRISIARFNESGQSIAMGMGRSLTVWSVPERRITLQVGETNLDPYRIGISPDSRFVAAGSYQGRLAIWDQQGKPVAHGLMFSGSINSLEFNSSGDLLAIASSDGSVKVWNLPSNRLEVQLSHNEAISAIFSPDGKLLFTAGIDGSGFLWELEKGVLSADPIRHRSAILSVRFSKSGQRFSTTSFDGTARIWDTDQALPITDRYKHGRPVRLSCFSADGEILATWAEDGWVRVFEPNQGILSTSELISKLRRLVGD